MGFCSYLNCSLSTRQKGVSLFAFPKDKSKRQRWCNLIKRQHGRDNFDADKATLCQKQFRDSDVTSGLGSSKRPRLREGAEPIPYLPNTLETRKRKDPTPRSCQKKLAKNELPSKTSAGTAAAHPIVHSSPSPTAHPARPTENTSQYDTAADPTDSPIDDLPTTTESTTNAIGLSVLASVCQYNTCRSTVDVAIQCDTLNLPSCDECVKCASIQPDMLVNDKIRRLEEEIRALTEQLKEISSHNEDLLEQHFKLLDENNKWERRLFSYVNLKDSEIPFYTGFPDLDSLEAMYKFLDPGDNLENINLCDPAKQSSSSESWKRGPAPKLSGRDLFLMTLCRLRQGFMEFHLVKLFNVSLSRVSVYLNAMINFMYLKLGSIPIWPDKEQVLQYMPEEFKKKYPSTRCIIDCTEIYSQCPSALRNQSMMYSHYKGRMTYKALVGITPGGGASFISALYPGSLSDRAIVERCGILNNELWDAGDSIMADRGFTISDLLEPMGVGLNIPAFLAGRTQFSVEEVVETQQIASWRIHVERYIRKIKCFHIFDRPIPLAMHGSINQIWTVCAMLANASNPLISLGSDDSDDTE